MTVVRENGVVKILRRGVGVGGHTNATGASRVAATIVFHLFYTAEPGETDERGGDGGTGGPGGRGEEPR